MKYGAERTCIRCYLLREIGILLFGLHGLCCASVLLHTYMYMEDPLLHHHDQYILDLERASVRACTLILICVSISRMKAIFFCFLPSTQSASVCTSTRLPHKRFVSIG